MAGKAAPVQIVVRGPTNGDAPPLGSVLVEGQFLFSGAVEHHRTLGVVGGDGFADTRQLIHEFEQLIPDFAKQ